MAVWLVGILGVCLGTLEQFFVNESRIMAVLILILGAALFAAVRNKQIPQWQKILPGGVSALHIIGVFSDRWLVYTGLGVLTVLAGIVVTVWALIHRRPNGKGKFALQIAVSVLVGVVAALILFITFFPRTSFAVFKKVINAYGNETSAVQSEETLDNGAHLVSNIQYDTVYPNGFLDVYYLEEEAEYGNRKYLEKQDFILAKQKEQLATQQSKLDELTLKVSDMETLLEDVSATAYDKAVEVVTDVVRTETRKEDMRMIEDTKKWVLSPERKASQTTREYAAHRLDNVLDKFLKTMQTTATRLQDKLLKPEVRQKGKEQVKEKARDSVLQLLNRLQAEQTQRKPFALTIAEKSENRFQ